MNSYVFPDRKKEIVEITWNYLLREGLSHASIGKLCRETNLAQSSLYHWFENRDDIWVSAGEYGIEKVADTLFRYTLRHTHDVRVFFESLLDEVDKCKEEIRLAIQITTSPIFGDAMRRKARGFTIYYERYADELTKEFGCTVEQANIFIYSVISCVVDYAVWDDREKTQMLLDNLCSRTVEEIEKNHSYYLIS